MTVTLDKRLVSDSLAYHSSKKPGKIELALTKQCETQRDLSLAYTPGVAAPSLEISKNETDVFKYTNRGNMVAVVSDGTAVLGLGNVGPYAALPVMEGKCVLFKRFAGIDAFPICVSGCSNKDRTTNIDKFVEIAASLEPTFGGMNLEDIAAPACFEIEEKLKKRTKIPVFHDDQHGTAVITMAGLLNALKIVNKKVGQIKVVFNGAGAAAIACAKFYIEAGVKQKNLFMCDSKGVIYKGRKDLNQYKKQFEQDTKARKLKDAIKDADVFVGLSVGGVVKKEMVRSMAKDPIVFALANPVPEIMPEEAKRAGARVVATGRSDFPNQVNNVLGFPGIFRGALDVRARDINQEMKLAASKALAELVAEEMSPEIKDKLSNAYLPDAKSGMFSGRNLKEDYIIPKPLDPRVVPRVARYVAEAAMKSRVDGARISNLASYEEGLRNRL